MAETKAEATADGLAQALCALVANGDHESARVALRDRLRRTEPWVARAHHQRKLLGAAIASLGKNGDLEALVKALDRADNEAHRRWHRDNPELHPRAGRTADELRVFLAEVGPPSARAVFARALRKAEALSGAEAADHVVAHLAAGNERAAGRVVERLLDRFFGQPEADEVKGLRADLDTFLKALIDKDLAQAAARAIARHTAEAGRRLGAIDLQDLHELLKDLMKRYASDAVAARWAKAVGRADVKGKAVAQEVARLLKQGAPEPALDHLSEEVLAPLDDRFIAEPGAEATKRLDDCVAELARAAQLEAVVEAAYAADVAFQRANPHVMFVGTLPRLKSAIDRFGGAAAKDAFAAPFGALEARLAPPPEEAPAPAAGA